MRSILSADQMAAADRHTIDELGVSGLELMERAGTVFCEELKPQLESDKPIAVIVGLGNNGGDGLVIARLLMEAGYQIETLLCFPPDRFRGDAAENYRRFLDTGGVPRVLDQQPDLHDGYQWIVDAVFGTGLNRPVSGRLASLFQALNRHQAPIAAVDLPSGLSGNTGRVLGPALHAALTVTFQSLKIAHTVTPACGHCGKTVVRDIGIRMNDSSRVRRFFLEAEDFQRPARANLTHKGSFGTLAILGGFRGMEGAANLAGLAALRFGAGKVRIYSDSPGGRFHHDSLMVENFESLAGLRAYQAVVVGPGLSPKTDVFRALDQLELERFPVVWDAGGLDYLAQRQDRNRQTSWLLTPHPGEAARILNVDTKTIQNDRLAAIDALGQAFPEAWILLKGYRSLIRNPEGELFVCGVGNAALATAGSGDVLSGMIGALLAQGFSPEDAILSACIRHGMAADRWTRHYRDYSMIAEDIIADLRH